MAIAEAVPHRLKLPLRGDENGDVRINIMGCSGAGKVNNELPTQFLRPIAYAVNIIERTGQDSRFAIHLSG